MFLIMLTIFGILFTSAIVYAFTGRASRKRTVLILGCLAVTLYALLLYPWDIPYASPIPFVGSWWENHTMRHSMVWHVRLNVVGLHRDDVLEMLGSPERYTFSGSNAFIYRLHSEDSGYFWRHLIILFDENEYVRYTLIANPNHVLGG